MSSNITMNLLDTQVLYWMNHELSTPNNMGLLQNPLLEQPQWRWTWI